MEEKLGNDGKTQKKLQYNIIEERTNKSVA